MFHINTLLENARRIEHNVNKPFRCEGLKHISFKDLKTRLTSLSYLFSFVPLPLAEKVIKQFMSMEEIDVIALGMNDEVSLTHTLTQGPINTLLPAYYEYLVHNIAPPTSLLERIKYKMFLRKLNLSLLSNLNSSFHYNVDILRYKYQQVLEAEVASDYVFSRLSLVQQVTCKVLKTVPTYFSSRDIQALKGLATAVCLTHDLDHVEIVKKILFQESYTPESYHNVATTRPKVSHERLNPVLTISGPPKQYCEGIVPILQTAEEYMASWSSHPLSQNSQLTVTSFRRDRLFSKTSTRYPSANNTIWTVIALPSTVR